MEMVSKQFFYLWNCDRNFRQTADREEVNAELCELKQNFAPAATVSENLTPDAARIRRQLRARCKKSKTDLADLEAILEILES